MKILTVIGEKGYNAGPKAPKDIIDILKNKYNAKPINLVQSKNLFKKIIYRFKIFSTVISCRIKKEILVLQFPMYETSKILNMLFMFSLKMTSKKMTIVLIHDLEGLRNNDKVLLEQDINRLNSVGYVIAHNDIMKKYLQSIGVKSKIYNLELFDYLVDGENVDFIPTDSKTVVYAGNLVKVKSPFLYEIEEDKINFDFNVFGVGMEENTKNGKISYKGKYPPNELPNKLTGKLGLIWDGKIGDDDEETGMKRYTKYNNPHKLSCYMATGIPVVVWKKAAIANFVEKNDVGYVINNIYDINNLDLSSYEQKLNNVKVIKNNVRMGYYTINVFEKIIADMKG